MENKISDLSIKIEKDKAEFVKNRQLVEMYEKLSSLLQRHSELIDEIKLIDNPSDDSREFNLQRNAMNRKQVAQQIDVVKSIIAKLDEKNVKQIEGRLELPPLVGVKLNAK